MSRVSYTGRADRRQPPLVRFLAAALLALSMAGCAGLGLPFNEAATGGAAATSPTLLPARTSARAGDHVDPTDWMAVRATIARFPASAGAGTSLDWRNPLTNSDGTVSLLTDAASRSGKFCHSFATTINDLRGIRRYRIEACRAGDGWQLSAVAPDTGTAL